MDRGIDASRRVGPAALRSGRVCGGGGAAARGTGSEARRWRSGSWDRLRGATRAPLRQPAGAAARPTCRACSRASERGPRRFSEATRSGAPGGSGGRGANVRCPTTEPAARSTGDLPAVVPAARRRGAAGGARAAHAQPDWSLAVLKNFHYCYTLHIHSPVTLPARASGATPSLSASALT